MQSFEAFNEGRQFEPFAHTQDSKIGDTFSLATLTISCQCFRYTGPEEITDNRKPSRFGGRVQRCA
jgi:hypothetical protein